MCPYSIILEFTRRHTTLISHSYVFRLGKEQMSNKTKDSTNDDSQLALKTISIDNPVIWATVNELYVPEYSLQRSINPITSPNGLLNNLYSRLSVMVLNLVLICKQSKLNKSWRIAAMYLCLFFTWVEVNYLIFYTKKPGQQWFSSMLWTRLQNGPVVLSYPVAEPVPII